MCPDAIRIAQVEVGPNIAVSDASGFFRRVRFLLSTKFG